VNEPPRQAPVGAGGPAPVESHPAQASGSAGDARPWSWVWLLPSVADLVLLGVYRLVSAIPVFDPDLWWHLRTGDLIWATRRLPRVDIYSSTAAGRPWLAHEWLSELLLAGGWRLAGMEAMGLFQAGMLVLAMATVSRHLRAVGSPFPLSVPLVVVALLLILPNAHPRPYLFTLCFLPLVAYGVDAWGPRRARTWVLVAVVFALWANLHGGFVFGLGYLGLRALGEAWRERRLPTTHLALLGLATAAVLVNPYGVALLTYPLQYRPGSIHYSLVMEWASLDFHQPYTWFVEATFLAAFLAVLLKRQTGWQADLLCILAFGQMAFTSVRNVPLLGVVAAPILARHLAAALPAFLRPDNRVPLRPPGPGASLLARLGERLRMVLVLDRRLNGQVWIVIALAASALGLAFRKLPAETWEPPPPPAMAGMDLPFGAAAFLAQEPCVGRLLNDYGWGGYLIWRLHPVCPVFVDGRADLYGPTVLEDYATLLRLGEGWEQLLDAYDIRTVLLPPDTPLIQLLRRDPGWRLRYEDEAAVVLRRDAPAVGAP